MINNRWIIDDFHRLSIGFSDLLIDCQNLDRLDWIIDWIGLDWQPWF